MRLFQLEYIKDAMRARGYKISKDTNKADICDLLYIEKSSSYKSICQRLEIDYPVTDGWFRESRKVYLHYKAKSRKEFDSISQLQKFLNISLKTSNRCDIFDRVFSLGGSQVYISFEKERRDFESLLSVRSSKFLLVVKLFNENHRFRIGASLKEIFQRFNLPYPPKNKLKFLCRVFDVP